MHPKGLHGGRDRTRTCDLLLLKQRLNLFFEDFHSLRESLRAIQERMHAIRDQQEGEQQDQNIPPGWLEPILAANQQTETDRAAHDNRQYRVQNSLRWAAWFAFIAAAVYAGITYQQWRDLRRNFRTDARAWV
jgi:hypothetical protein